MARKTAWGEIFKPIEGFGGKYFISKSGHVLSYIKGVEYILNLSKTRDGYLKCHLSISNRRSKTPTVHRLVARYWLRDWDAKLQVNHMDGNKLNNCIHNLEMCTAHQNQTHAVQTGLRIMPNGIASSNAKLDEAAVLYIRANYKTTKSLAELSQKYSVVKSAIHNAYTGRTWGHV